MSQNPIQLQQMQRADIDAAVELIRKSMNGIEARFAHKTMDFHFACLDHGLNDGRHYYVYRKEGQILGLVGLHNYIWGPRENVWLTWFCVHPDMQGKGLGTTLLSNAEAMARKLDYRKFFIETYDMPDFSTARAFYEKQGFTLAGKIEDYLPNKAGMIVYLKHV
ncbi:MAG: GNAT family N-acetyltransferase [Sedimentisphaerales bacterium]|nr:GNAT family N-acetyltransferase [Sedimentisphaerales bacterium]